MSDEKKPSKAKTAKDRGLGRGLSALMADISVPKEVAKVDEAPLETKSAGGVEDTSTGQVRAIQFVSIGRLAPNPDQPRKQFDKAEMTELTRSIREKGILQPLLVRPLPPGNRSHYRGNLTEYQIVAGERRFQAALMASVDSVPVLIRNLSDQEVLEIGVVENVQRSDLSPMEEARAYRALMDDFGRTQEDVSEAVGKSRPYIAQLVRFLEYPSQIQDWLAEGKLTTGHGKALFGVEDPLALATRVVEEGLSVRATEQIARETKEGKAPTPPKPKDYKDPNIIKLESDLRDALGLAVDLRHKSGKGEVRIKYKTNAQLEDLMRRLKADQGEA